MELKQVSFDAIYRRGRSTGGQLQATVKAFAESDLVCAEVINPEWKTGQNHSASITTAIKRLKLHGVIKAVSRGGHTYLIKINALEKYFAGVSHETV